MPDDDRSFDNAVIGESADVNDCGMHVDGDAFVAPSGCTMPTICVLTNVPVREKDMVFTNLYWTPNSVAPWGLLGGLPLIFSYMVGREICSITFGLHPTIRRRKIFFTILKLIASMSLLAGSVCLAATDSRSSLIEPAMWGFFILFLVSVVLIFVGNKPLRVVKYQAGMFWIKGFSQEYLDSLEI